MNNFNLNTKNKEEWLTPPKLIKALGLFDLDPCYLKPEERPWDTAKFMFYKDFWNDGLKQDWLGRVWLNPPYGSETFTWIEKLSNHGNGIALIFARTETKGFHEYIFKKADGIFFFKGRLKFFYPSGAESINAANAPSCLIAYGIQNMYAIEKAKLNGKLVWLKPQPMFKIS
jgi:hypothetical protein